jgi:hypothetical protein
VTVRALTRVASMGLAIFAVACFSAMPASASPSKGKAKYHTSKNAEKKKRTAKRSVRQARATTYRRTDFTEGLKWYGWVVTPTKVALYHEGIAYHGGTPRGPATWYNNYEGGFNAAVFWKLYDQNLGSN